MGMLSHLRLHGFRNYSNTEVDLAPGLNLVIGRNAQGKSNLLEAVCYLAVLRSFRTGRIHPLTQWNQQGFELTADYIDAFSDRHCLTIEYAERRQLYVDGKGVEKASEFINQFICIPFVPEDIDLVKGAAGIRRRFLDILLSQTVPGHLYMLQKYNEVLKNRNYMLKQPQKYPVKALLAYDELLLQYGTAIMRERVRAIQQINQLLQHLSAPVFGKGELNVRYQSSVLGTQPRSEDGAFIAETFRKTLARSLAKDLERGQTRYGPHRDDLQLLLAEKKLSDFGSEGEMRICSLTLRLASLQFVKANAAPKGIVLLVDDVTGELDMKRRQNFYDLLEHGDQILLAATEIPHDLKGAAGSIIEVENGTLKVHKG